jgi:adenine/guanine/hypoxanthine permease
VDGGIGSGVLIRRNLLILTIFGIRQLLVSAIPPELYAAVASGIGFFIAVIGLRNSGVVVASPATLVTLGNLREPNTILALFGFLLTAGLLSRNVCGAMLIGVLSTTAVGVLLGVVSWEPSAFILADNNATAFQLDILGAIRLGVLDIAFVFLFVDLFDNVGTLVAVGKKAALFDEANRIPRLNRILVSDATATIAGSMAGTSTVVSYIESAAGVVAGGRSGVTAVVVGLLFLVALFVAPIAGAMPAAATAPPLILVGSMMASHMAEIDWSDTVVSIPAFLTIITIPLTFSIANGIAFGFTAYTALAIMRGEFHRVNCVMCVLTALFVLRFAYLGGY